MQASRRTTDASRVCFSLALARIGERLGCPPPRRETAALVAGFYWFRQLYQAHCGHPMSIQGCTLQVTSRQRKSLPEASWSLTGSGWRSKNARNVTPSPTDTETFPHLSMMPDYEQRLDRDDEIQPSRQLQGLSPPPWASPNPALCHRSGSMGVLGLGARIGGITENPNVTHARPLSNPVVWLDVRRKESRNARLVTTPRPESYTGGLHRTSSRNRLIDDG